MTPFQAKLAALDAALTRAGEQGGAIVYKVVWGYWASRNFDDIDSAVIWARERAGAAARHITVSIWQRTVVIAVVTDDANGLTLHRFKTWPKDLECAYA